MKSQEHTCPKTGRRIAERATFFGPIALGIAATAWFLLRVIPKPSRASYPCQRAALGTMTGFFVWLTGLVGPAVVFRRSLKGMRRLRLGATALGCAAAITGAAWAIFGQPADSAQAAGPWVPTDPPNTVLGIGRGIYPGRVVWARDPNVIAKPPTAQQVTVDSWWDPTPPLAHWWDPGSVDQGRLEAMLSATLQGLSGKATDAEAWNAIFTYFNGTHLKGNVGYKPGEKIVIKINQNNGIPTVATDHAGNADTSKGDTPNCLNGSPHLILATIRQLVNNAGVASGDIIVYDVSRVIGDNIYAYCKADPSCANVTFIDAVGGEGRQPPGPSVPNSVVYGGAIKLGTSIPQFIVSAGYMINMSLVKNHGNMGPTSVMKNHYGSGFGQEHTGVALNQHHPMVELASHRDIGEKTVLFMVDFLFTAAGPDWGPHPWKLPPFGDGTKAGWPASIMLSQDGIACESVVWDFVNTEMFADPYSDCRLREGALISNPPSMIPYPASNAPGGLLPQSLGAHEHWSNATDKKYSRNLGKNAGIELFQVTPGQPVDAGVPPIGTEDGGAGNGSSSGAGSSSSGSGSSGGGGAGSSSGSSGNNPVGDAGNGAQGAGNNSGCSCRIGESGTPGAALYVAAIAAASVIARRRKR